MHFNKSGGKSSLSDFIAEPPYGIGSARPIPYDGRDVPPLESSSCAVASIF
jgi:hypothetical protein